MSGRLDLNRVSIRPILTLISAALLRASVRRHRRAQRDRFWPSGGWIGSHTATPRLLLNNCLLRPVNAYRWRDGDMRWRRCVAGLLRAESQFRRVKGHRAMPNLMKALEESARARPAGTERGVA